ncbi:MAG TPA: hypothetical protein VG408_08145, partial [Actinomycetota bacterium]|nr:hypothetical protein [Actinomycetota bacterium]
MPDQGLLVVALGGNAMQDPRGDDSVESDFARTATTAAHLVDLARAGWRLVVTHGNGPQVGNHLFRSEVANREGNLPLLPLDVCVADTQGGMGYMLQQCLENAFGDAGIPAVVVSLVTQVVVDKDDPAFATPSKPVGEVIPAPRARELEAMGWSLVEESERDGFRRVVASPEPREVVEAAAIRTLVDDGVVVVAAGGGGIPVVATERGLIGVGAVVDKDLASALLAAASTTSRGSGDATTRRKPSRSLSSTSDHPIASSSRARGAGWFPAGRGIARATRSRGGGREQRRGQVL